MCSPMPQSTGMSPRPIAARSSYTLRTSWCGVTLSGIVVILSARRFHSAMGMAVSPASVHFFPRNGDQSTAYLLLKLVNTGSTVCLPASMAARKDLGHVVAQRLAHSLRRQAVGVQLAGSGVCTNFLVHQRLGQCGRVLFVMAQLAETDDVHDNILAEFQPVVQRQPGRQHHRFGIVAVDVQTPETRRP